MESPERGSRSFKGRLTTFSFETCLLKPGLMVMALCAFAPALAAASDQTVATIGDSTITEEDYLSYLRGFARAQLYHGGSPETLRRLADEALENLITDRLVAQEAERRGIEGDRERIEQRMREIEARYKDDADWSRIEEQLPLVRREIAIDEQIGALKSSITDVPRPGEADLRQFYDDNKHRFTEPRSYDLDLILVGLPPSALQQEREAAEAHAREIVADLKGGADFASLARSQSSHGSAADGGALGRVHIGQLPEAAMSAVTQIAPGEVTAPIRILEGYAIFRLNKVFDERLRPFDDVRDRAERLYMREAGKQQWDAFLADLREQTPVRTSDVGHLVERILKSE